MALDLPKYVTARKRKDKTQRFYFQVPEHMRPDNWPPYVRLADDIGEMFRQAEDLNKRLVAERNGAPAGAYLKGSIPWLLAEYHKSPRYRNLAPSTQELYDWCAEFIREWSERAKHPHVKMLTRPTILKFLKQFDDKPTKKKKIAVFLGVMMAVAIDEGCLTHNPALRLNLSEPEPDVHIWTLAEVNAMVTQADALGMSRIGDAILINYEIGQRPADVLSMAAPLHYDAGFFLFRQRKTGEFLKIGASDRLQARLAGRTGLLIATQQGNRYTRTGFQTVFNTVRAKAGLVHCTFQQLRHTAVVNLARAGCTVPEIASITGHTISSVAAILKRYLPRDAEVAANAIAKRVAYQSASTGKPIT